MELYNRLFEIPADEIDTGDLIEFPYVDDEGEDVIERVSVENVDVDVEGVTIIGKSEVLELGSTVTYVFADTMPVTVLGG